MTGEVLLQFSVYDPVHTSATPQQIQSKLAGLTSSEGESDLDPSISRSSTFELEEEDDDDDVNDSEDPTKPETAEKRKRRLRIARIKKKAQEKAYELSGSSGLAGVLFLEIQKVTDLPPERNSVL